MGLGVGTAGWPWGQLDPAPSREVVQKPAGGTWGHGERCQAVPSTLQGTSPPVPMSPDWAVAQGVLGCPWTGSCRSSEPMGAGASWTNQLFFLNQNVEDECAFSKGNQSKNMKSKNFPPNQDSQQEPLKTIWFYCSSGNQRLESSKHLFFLLEEQLHLVLALMSCVSKPLIEPFPSRLELP